LCATRDRKGGPRSQPTDSLSAPGRRARSIGTADLDPSEALSENLQSKGDAAKNTRAGNNVADVMIMRDHAMGTRDERIDAYIARSAEFARPILKHLREVVHGACPEVEETMKWSFPNFMYKGILCSMASFKEHCAFGFWKGSLILNKEGDYTKDGMGHLGRLTKLSDLPSKKVLTGYIKEAMKLNDTGVKSPTRSKPKAPKEVVVPQDLTSGLSKNKKALATFEKFSPSHKREYIEWITEAKTEATRTRRLETAIEWMAEGKPRNWKYMNC
jgi:uncharacterized protein YdeI (YjbR/CyaY-like superfamily)